MGNSQTGNAEFKKIDRILINSYIFVDRRKKKLTNRAQSPNVIWAERKMTKKTIIAPKFSSNSGRKTLDREIPKSHIHDVIIYICIRIRTHYYQCYSGFHSNRISVGSHCRGVQIRKCSEAIFYSSGGDFCQDEEANK